MAVIMPSTAKVHEVAGDAIVRERRGEENEARAMALYLGRQLGGHKLSEIGKPVGLQKSSSVSTTYLAMKRRIAQEAKLARRARRIETHLLNSQQQT